MTFKDIVVQMYERGNAMQTFWGFYITISIGLVAFFGNAKRSPRLPYVAAILSVAFVGFAFVNGHGMQAIAAQRWAFFSRLSSAAAADIADAQLKNSQSPVDGPHAQLTSSLASELSKISRPPTPEEVVTYHVISDCLVLIAIWSLCLWKDTKTLEQKKLDLIKEITEAT